MLLKKLQLLVNVYILLETTVVTIVNVYMLLKITIIIS